MRKEDIDVLLTWQVDGKIVEEPSLLWQGMAYMDLEMNYYTLRGTNAELQDSFLIKGERLPIQDLEMSEMRLINTSRNSRKKLFQAGSKTEQRVLSGAS